MESGWDPEVKKYFRKILNSIGYGLLWLMSMVLIGLYNGLAIVGERSIVLTILFYIVLVVTLFLLIRYYYRTWKK